MEIIIHILKSDLDAILANKPVNCHISYGGKPDGGEINNYQPQDHMNCVLTIDMDVLSLPHTDRS